ncbi:MAG: rRNA maturation RNase YbeY [Phycisphaerales bacterium]|nr:rRNA maturation RNase YbeY [Phycisphaerales bacterium]
MGFRRVDWQGMDDGGRTQAPNGPAATPGKESLRIDLADATGRLSEPACGWLMERLSEALPEACRRESGRTGGKVRGGEVRVRVIADDEMSKMHEEYAGVPGTTDVLTFDMSVDEGDGGGGVPPLDVDLVVCLDEAQRQASARGHGATPQLELLLYTLHGVLHCLGHDDHEEPSFRAMHDAEDAILTAIGVGPVFARPEFKPAEGGAA